jgi:hypothetical protein
LGLVLSTLYSILAAPFHFLKQQSSKKAAEQGYSYAIDLQD